MTDDVPSREPPEDFRPLQEQARRLKAARVAASHGDDLGDLVPMVNWYREGELVATGHADQVDRDRGLQLAGLGVWLFRADRIDLVVDAHMADQDFLRRYGRYPDPGELSALCEQGDVVARSMVTDVLLCCRAWRDSDQVAAMALPYHVDVTATKGEFATDAKARKARRDDPSLVRRNGTWVREHHRVHWIDAKSWYIDGSDDSRLDGRVPDALCALFRQPQQDPRDLPGGDQFGDQGAGWLISQLGFSVAVVSADPDLDLTRLAFMAAARGTPLVGPDGTEVDTTVLRDQLDVEALAAAAITDVMTDEMREAMISAAAAIKEQDQQEAQRLQHRRRAANN